MSRARCAFWAHLATRRHDRADHLDQEMNVQVELRRRIADLHYLDVGVEQAGNIEVAGPASPPQLRHLPHLAAGPIPGTGSKGNRFRP